MRLTVFGALALCLAITCAPGAALAQTAAPMPPPSPWVQAQREQAAKEAIETSRIYLQEKRLQLKINELRVKRAEQEDRHAIMTLYKQSVTDVFIFVLVMSMSSAGVYMSYLQFKKGIGDLAPRDAEGKPALGQIDPSTLKLGLDGIEISSSIVGLLLLGLSLAFFYLYLDRVYEIRVLPQAPTASAQTKP